MMQDCHKPDVRILHARPKDCATYPDGDTHGLALAGKLGPQARHQGKEENPMLTIHFQQLTELRFDTALGQFEGVVTLRYSLISDPETIYSTRIRTSVRMARKARFAGVESTMQQLATQRLTRRLEEVETDPVNIFAEDLRPLQRAA